MNDVLDQLARSRPPEGCLSDLALDRLRVGELSGAPAVHLAGCARCTSRAQVLAISAPPVRRTRPARRRRVWFALGGLVAAGNSRPTARIVDVHPLDAPPRQQ